MGPQASKVLAELEVATELKAPMQSQAENTQRKQVQQLTNASYQMRKGFIDGQDPHQQHYGLVKQVWKGYVDWVAPENVEAWKRGCEARPVEEGEVLTASAVEAEERVQQVVMAPAVEAEEEEEEQERGSLQVEVKGKLYGSSWHDADCKYDSGMHEFSITDSKGKQRRVENCWVGDVNVHRSSKIQHRFDISDGKQLPIALAAGSAGEKQRWMLAVETKEALRARQAEEALMAKYGVSTIEEAMSKKAEETATKEAAEKERREELMARFGIDTTGEFEAQEALLRKWNEQWPEGSVSVSEVEQLGYVGFAQLIQTSQQELEEARTQQEFGRCKKLQEKITHAGERDAEAREVFEDLQRCIRVRSMLIDAASEKDDFEKCEKMNAYVEEMQKDLGERTDKIALVVKYGGRGVDVMLYEHQAESMEALVVKHGVSTIEEARRKEAEEQAAKEAEQQALMAKHGVDTIKEARRKEADLKALMAEHDATHGM
jgi:hypothetical protein